MAMLVRKARPCATCAAFLTCTACCGGWQEPEAIAFGVSEDLAAVTSIYGCSVMTALDGPTTQGANAIECWLTVGADGTVAWAYGRLPGEAQTIQYEAESFDLGDAALTAALTTASGWWVVGEAATIALSEDEGVTWQFVDPGISADLHGLAEHDDQIVVVGDEVVVVHQPDDSWTELPSPPGGWGQLRAIYSDGSRMYAAGLDGIAWSTADPDGEWTVEDVGVATDLFAVGRARHEPNRVGLVGARGTLVVGDHDRGWTRASVETTADLVDISHSRILAADGEILEYIDGDIYPIDSLFPGARALHSDGLDIAVVGDQGEAQRIHRVRRCF